MPYDKNKIYEVRSHFFHEEKQQGAWKINSLIPSEEGEDTIYFAQFLITMQQMNPQTGEIMAGGSVPGEQEMEGVKNIEEAFARYEEFVKIGLQNHQEQFQKEQIMANVQGSRILQPFGKNDGMRR
jgi:hypothetical protein